MKKHLLLIEDDPKVSSFVSETLDGEFLVSPAASLGDAEKAVSEKKFDVAIYDYDLKGGGLEGYRKLRRTAPALPVIMISDLGDIAVAVSAAKLGVKDVLMKPLEADRFREAVERNAAKEKRPSALRLDKVSGGEWMSGFGEKISLMLSELRAAASGNADVVMCAEDGINVASVAELLHFCGRLSDRPFSSIDLRSFSRDSAEALFWSTVRGVMKEGGCGTVLLKNTQALDEHFVISILDFLGKRRSGAAPEGVDSSGRVVISSNDPVQIAELGARGRLSGFSEIHVPPLRDRRDDMPLLAAAFMSKYSSRYGRNVGAISSEVLEFLSAHGWPGNYSELELFIKLAVLNCSAGVLTMKDLPVNFEALSENFLRKTASGGCLGLEALKEGYERALYGAVLENFGGDVNRAADFLDVPGPVFSERSRDLGLLT